MKRGGGKSRLITGLKALPFFLFLGAALCLFPEDDSGERGDAAMAERYAQWAKDAIDQGRWSEALSGLERASDFANVSSDISYLLALARAHENKPRGMVLEALNHALTVDIWNLYDPGVVRLFRAGVLVGIKAYSEALDELSRLRHSPAEAVLTLRALAASRRREFRPYMSDTLDRFPRESGPVRFFLNFLKASDAAGRNPGKEDVQLLELIVRRLPVLLLNDPELAWMAAPFMRDSAEAKRLVEAYRAVRKPAPASLPVALKLGAAGEETVLEELFSPAENSLDLALLAEVRELLRGEEAKALFGRNLSAYTGVITEDEDGDGIPECAAEYSGGVPRSYTYDADQDGYPELSVYFEAGEPRRAFSTFPPENSQAVQMAEIRWERYPAVLDVELNGVRYIARPLDFHYSPFTFDALWKSGLLFPRRDPLHPPLTRRTLVSRALLVERPSPEFPGGVETVRLAEGIPVSAEERVGEQKVSETEFIRGRPQIQRVDLDFDGRMETARRFRRPYRVMEFEDLWNYDRDIEYTVSDWDRDGIYESGDPCPGE